MDKNIQNKKYEILLIAVIAARATSFAFNKIVLGSMEVFNLLAIRFLLAFLLLFALFAKRIRKITRRELLYGAVVGGSFFLVMACELTALKTASSSTVSLLENCAIIFVPLFEAVLIRALPGKITVISALTAALGVVLLTLQQGGLSGGAGFGILSAVLYAAAIIITARLSSGGVDSLRIGIVQVGTMGILSLIASIVFESPHLPSGTSQWLMIVLLAVVCTGFGFTLQPVAQSRVSVERAGLFCAVSPAVAFIIGAAVLHEKMGILSIIGLVLILASIILPYTVKIFSKKSK